MVLLCSRRSYAMRSVQYDRPILSRHFKGTLPLTIVFEPIGAVGDRRRVHLRSVLKLCKVLCKLGRYHRPDDTLVVRKVDQLHKRAFPSARPKFFGAHTDSHSCKMISPVVVATVRPCSKLR